MYRSIERAATARTTATEGKSDAPRHQMVADALRMAEPVQKHILMFEAETLAAISALPRIWAASAVLQAVAQLESLRADHARC
jgi:hypothetical protein